MKKIIDITQKKYTHKINVIFLTLFAFFTLACEQVKPEEPVIEEKEKTVLIYMVANNNLYQNAINNFSDITKSDIPDNGYLLVYYHLYNKSPFLLNVHKQDQTVIVDTVYRFPADINSAKTSSLISAMNITKTMFPAKKYGLILWSHGTGWLPKAYYSNGAFPGSKVERSASYYYDRFAHLVKSFGSENGEEIEIIDLAKAIPYKQEFIIFDACLMGCIEVAYEFKEKTDYLIASPAEILTSGFPYSKIIKHLFKTDADVVAAAQEYHNYYNSQSGYLKSSTISVTKSSELDSLALYANKIFEKDRANIQNVNLDNIQPYFRINKHWFYDLNDFLSQLSTDNSNLAKFKEAMDKAIIYKATTNQMIDLPIVRFSGTSTYIPKPANEELDKFYSNFAWNKACGMIK